MVADEHFGGFLTHKSETSEKKSWKERMGELILQTRKEKVYCSKKVIQNFVSNLHSSISFYS